MLPAPKRGFTPAEFALRLQRAQAIMLAHQLDSLLVTTPPNIRYFTGLDRHLIVFDLTVHDMASHLRNLEPSKAA